jgi:alpha-beta hydrolase superfamily lysophospholipase
MRAWSPGDHLAGEERPFFLPNGVAVNFHAAAGTQPRAAVVLAGPMTLERSHGYLTWVRWARNLALNGYDVYRFDYRGVGESLGSFRDLRFQDWQDDLQAVVQHARAQRHGRVVVVGLRLGALLGRAVFENQGADALLAWDPPVDGKAMLMDMLRRKLAADYMEFGGDRKTRDDYVRELEAGRLVEVEGYQWSKGLWQSAASYAFTAPERLAGEWHATYLDARTPEKLPNRDFYSSVRIPKPAFWLQSAHLIANLAELFTLTLERLHAWSNAWSASDQREPVASTATTATAGTRTLEVLDLEGGRCVGSVHAPAGNASKVGLLWVNFGYVPRDGHGGLAAQASDALARRGVPCFRFDLPGLGDSPGSLPAHTHQFFPVVTGGAFTTVTTQLVRKLCQTHNLEGLVVAGLCGGAVNAIYTADAERTLVKGLVLLEPEMYVTEPKAQDDETVPPLSTREWVRQRLKAQGALDGSALGSLVDRALTTRLPYEAVLREQLGKRLPIKKLSSKVFSYWGWMRLLTDENKYARYVPLPKKAILDFVLSRSPLPSVTNMPLTQAWSRWLHGGHPALVITASGKLREVFFDRVNTAVLAGHTPSTAQFQHVRLKGTNHIFTTGGAIETVIGHLEHAWPLFG